LTTGRVIKRIVIFINFGTQTDVVVVSLAWEANENSRLPISRAQYGCVDRDPGTPA
jgi:hypothetical protein